MKRSEEAGCPPPGWGSDSLSKFADTAYHNIMATYANLRAEYDALAKIDGLHDKMIENLNQSPEFVAGFLLIRTHSYFRGAALKALSGQVAEGYMLQRGALESALYGLYAAGDDNRQKIWLNRHEDDASRKRVRREFTISNVLNHLQSVDAGTHDVAKRLYDRTIDYGGHPNERSVTTQVKTEVTESRIDFTAEYFCCGDLPHRVVLKSAAQAGICCLDMFCHVFRDRYRILGIDLELDEIRKGF